MALQIEDELDLLKSSFDKKQLRIILSLQSYQRNIPILVKASRIVQKLGQFFKPESQSHRAFLHLPHSKPQIGSQQQINNLIHMEDQSHLMQNLLRRDCQSFRRVFEDRSEVQSQKCAIIDSNLNHNPFSYYHPCWALPNQYYFNYTPFTPQLEFWTKCQEEKMKINFENSRPNAQKTILVQNSNRVSSQLEGELQNKKNKPKQLLPKRKQKIQKTIRQNHKVHYWRQDENKRYADFLSKNSQLFGLSVTEKKNLRVNVLMSKKVKTRTPQQCHSHHQKMMKKYGSITQIIQTLKLDHQKVSNIVPKQQQINQLEMKVQANSIQLSLKVEI